MLSTVLKSDTAVKVSIGIMDAFVRMRRYLSENSLMLERIKTVELEQLELKKESEEKFNKIFAYISGHEEDNQKIFFDGQVYDALSFLTNLITKAKKSIILVDNYIDISTLDIISKKNAGVVVSIFTLPSTRLAKNDLSKFNSQYGGLVLRTTNKFHDRFLILDDIIAYHIGASLKDAGKKCFGISLIEDEELISAILVKLK